MAYVVEGEVVYEVIDYPNGGSVKQMHSTTLHVELDGPDMGQVGTELAYVARLGTWQNEPITNDSRTIQIEVRSLGEVLGQLSVAQGEEFVLVFPGPGQYVIRASIEGTHTPASKVVVINE